MEILGTIIGVLIAVLIMCIIAFGAMIYSCLSWGYISSLFYIWFIQSQIQGLPDFSILQFIGFAFFIHAIMPKFTLSIKEEYKDNSWRIVVAYLIYPWIFLLFGYLAYIWMY